MLYLSLIVLYKQCSTLRLCLKLVVEERFELCGILTEAASD